MIETCPYKIELCSTRKAVPVARDFLQAELKSLGIDVRTSDVPGLLCNIAGGDGCPAKANLQEFGSRSMYAK